MAAVTLEELWPSPASAGFELIWAAQEARTWTRAGEGGVAAVPGGRLESIGPRPAEIMLPAAVLSTEYATVTNRGGVTLSNGAQLRGAALATSIDVAPLRFFATSRSEDCKVSQAVLLAQPGDQVFGHQLFDLVPRVLTARRALGAGIPFLISHLAVDAFSALLAQFGLQDAQLVALPQDSGVATHVHRLYLVTGARQDYKFDAQRLEEVAASLPRASGSEFRGDLFLSRARLTQPQIANRPLLNREEVEDVFRRAGYTLVFPEEHSLSEMARMIQQVRHLAGEDGSALHHVLWRPERLVCLGHGQSAVNLHLRLCDALGIDYVYLSGETAELASETSFYPRDRSWSVPRFWLSDVLGGIHDSSSEQQPTELDYAAHVTNKLTDIVFDGVSVDAMDGHFDAAAPGIGSQFLEDAAIYDERYAGVSGIHEFTQKIAGTLQQGGVDALRPRLVLDVGSGSGNSVFALAQLFPEAQILASDLSPHMVAIIQHRAAAWNLASRIKAAVADASLLRPKPDHFDLIVGSSILHHLIAPFEALETLLLGLRPGGAAVFYEPFQAGNLILRQCLGEILRRAPYHQDVPDELLDFVQTLVLGLDLMFEESRVDPLLLNLDDKWIFTRGQFDEAARRLDLPPPLITSTNLTERTWENRLTALIQSGLGSADTLPAWVTEVFRSADTRVSPMLREELLMEGAILFRKPRRDTTT